MKYKDPYLMTDEEAKEELYKLESKYAGPYGSGGNNPIDSRSNIEDMLALAPRKQELRERLGREYWQRTKKNVFNSERMPEKAHRKTILQAIAAGKTIPSEVMADYPDLVQP